MQIGKVVLAHRKLPNQRRNARPPGGAARVPRRDLLSHDAASRLPRLRNLDVKPLRRNPVAVPVPLDDRIRPPNRLRDHQRYQDEFVPDCGSVGYLEATPTAERYVGQTAGLSERPRGPPSGFVSDAR